MVLLAGNVVTTEQMGQGGEVLGPGEFFQHTAQVDHMVGACDRGQWRVVRPQTEPANRGYGDRGAVDRASEPQDTERRDKSESAGRFRDRR